MAFGKRIKNLRLERKLTMQEVAYKIGIAKSSYAGYEGESRTPPISKLIALAQLFHVSTDYILGLTSIRDPVDSLQEKFLSWNGTTLNERELEIVQNLMDLIINKVDEKNNNLDRII